MDLLEQGRHDPVQCHKRTLMCFTTVSMGSWGCHQRWHPRNSDGGCWSWDAVSSDTYSKDCCMYHLTLHPRTNSRRRCSWGATFGGTLRNRCWQWC